MCKMPASLEAALVEAGKLESIKATQKRLQRVKKSTDALPVAAVVGESEILTPEANALRRGSEISLDLRVDEFTKEVKRLMQKLAQLRGAKGEQRPLRPAPSGYRICSDSCLSRPVEECDKEPPDRTEATRPASGGSRW